MKTGKRFNWNPFSLIGEAPASLRWLNDGGESDFATKEDYDLINSNPSLKRAYDSMKAGVTKKFQAWAEEKRQFSNAYQQLQDDAAKIDEQLGKWETWYQPNAKRIDSALNSTGDEGSGRERGEQSGQRERGGSGVDWEGKFNKLVETMEGYATQFHTKLGTTERLLGLSQQLNRLIRKHPEIDEDKVLDYALKNGVTDLNRAYTEAYHDELLDKEVNTRLEPRVKEEIAKRANLETGSGSLPTTLFELKKDTSKSWASAGDEFLKERSQEAADKGPQGTKPGAGDHV